ncbi:MAG: glucosaminidase domain-containing protein [Bacterioplanes sp.]|nr:glucosaminidase domain-containing protein [Bacterioplanes sp.]
MRIFFLMTLFAALFITGCDRESTTDSNASNQLAELKKTHKTLPDFSVYTDVNAKKDAFFNYLLPLIEQVNYEIAQERQYILSAQARYPKLTNTDQEKLQALGKKYSIEEAEGKLLMTQLLHQVRPVPTSLILAQAANESAWGTSRFAVQGNNLFGQWCFRKGCGLVPQGRGEGQIHEVAKFATPLHSVRSYVRNLNSHWSYVDLRQLREDEIDSNGYATGHHLAAGLIRYSERGEEYIEEIRSMIRFNQLERFDIPPSAQATE